jgi:hypothetical protein
MSQRFIRCGHCGLPHEARETPGSGETLPLGDDCVVEDPAIRDTEPTGRPAVLVRRKVFRAPGSSADDVEADDSETGEPTQLMPGRGLRAHKPPRS